MDDVDNAVAQAELEAEQFAAALKAQRERALPASNFCADCSEILEPHRRQFALCFYCASKRESIARRHGWKP